MSKLRIRVLGPICAEIEHTPLRLSKPRQREVLGILAAARGRSVSTQYLIEELWEDAPPGAVGAVRTFIGELRRILEPDRPARTPPAVLLTTAGGYALAPQMADVDLWRAEHAVQAAAGLDLAARKELLAAALDEWHGAAFEEFSTRPWAKAERARIAELRASTAEQLAETRLGLGRPGDVLTPGMVTSANIPGVRKAGGCLPWRFTALPGRATRWLSWPTPAPPCGMTWDWIPDTGWLTLNSGFCARIRRWI